MRLHLNKKLRAALIAAITAVGFTLPQTQAEESNLALFNLSADTLAGHAGATSVAITQGTVTLTISTSWAQGLGSGTTGYTTFNVAGVSTDLLNTNAMVTDGSIADTYGTFVSAGARNAGADLTITLSGLNAGGKYDLSLVCGIDFEGAGSWSNITSPNAYTSSMDDIGNDKIQAKSLSGFAIVDMVADAEGCITFTIDDKGAHTAVINGIAIAGAPYVPPTELTWAGTEQDHVLTSSVWDNGQTTTADYSATDPLHFGEDGWKEVTVASATAAQSIEVEAGDYTIDAVAGALSMQKLTVDEGATLSLKGTVEVAGAVTVADEHALVVNEGAVLKVTGESAAKTLLSGTGVDNSGTVQVASDVTIGDSLTSKMGGTLTVADGKKLTLGTTKDSHSIDLTSLDALVLGQGANIDTKALKVDINNLTANGSTLNMLDTKAKDTDGVVLHGTTTLEGDLTITSGWKYKVNIEKLAGTGSLELTGGNEEHRAVIGDVDIDSLTVTNKMNNVDITGTVALSGVLGVNGTTNVTGGNAMTIGGLTGSAALNVANGITFDVAEGGDYSYTGTLTVGGQIVKQGTGTQTIGGYAMHRTVTAREGELVLSGDFAIDAITDGDIDSGFVNASGAVANNGFAYKSGNMIVYVEDGGTVNTEGATFTLGGQEVTVAEDGKYALEYTVDKTTLWVNEDTESFAAYKEDAGDTLTTVGLAAGTTINMDSDGASIALAMRGSATVNATAAATISSISGWENHTLNVDGTSEVTLANLTTLTGSSALEVKGGTLNTKKFVLNSADAKLNVNNGSTMNVTGDLTPTLGSVYVAGEVNISGSLDLSNGSKADVDLHIDGAGAVTSAGLWMDTKSSILLDEGGAYSVGSLTFTGKVGDNSSITYVADSGDAYYGTGNSKFTITNASLSANGNVTIGNTLVDCDVVVDGGHTVTLNAAADSVTVRDGGTIQIGSGSAAELLIENGGIVGDSVEVSQAKIAAGNTATFAEGLDDSDSAVMFFAGEDVQVQVTNNSGEAAAYNGIANEDMKVTAGTMMSMSTEDIVVDNSLVIDSVVNYDMAGALTINTIDTDVLTSIENMGGQVTLMNVASEPVVLNDVTITAGSIVAIYQATTVAPEQEATVTITDTLTAGGATLKANLTLMGREGDELLSWNLNGTQMTLGSTLTLNTDSGLIQLDNETMLAIAALGDRGEYVELVLDAGTGLQYDGKEWFDGVFSRTYTNEEGLETQLGGDYKVQLLDNGNFGIVKFSNVPEPTTGTLSLLALAALAARRRKH